MAAAALLLVMFLSLMNTGGMHGSEAARLLMGLQALTGIPYDLCVHFAMYAYLGVTFWIAFVWRRITRGHMALIWGALTLWGIAMECLQGWGTARGWWSRSFSYADMAANSLGAAAGVAVACDAAGYPSIRIEIDPAFAHDAATLARRLAGQSVDGTADILLKA